MDCLLSFLHERGDFLRVVPFNLGCKVHQVTSTRRKSRNSKACTGDHATRNTIREPSAERITLKTGYAIALAMLVGIGAGVAGVHSLQAQAKPPVYMIGLVDVRNVDGYAKEYLPAARASIKAHGGVTLAAGLGRL
jgi:hypothetical protein